MKKIFIIVTLISFLLIVGYNNSKLNSTTNKVISENNDSISVNSDMLKKYDFLSKNSDFFIDYDVNEDIKLAHSNIFMPADFHDSQVFEPQADSNNRFPQKEILVNKIKEHVVKQGENLWLIAKKYNVDIDTLIGANDINNMNRIAINDTLKILPVKGILYKVGPGENLFSITKKFKVQVTEVIKANGIDNPDRIKSGQLLIIPGAKPEFSYEDRLKQKFIRPVSARISSYYGRRWGRMHEGIDFAIMTGSNVKAAGAGKIVWSGWVRGYGETIIIEHQQGLRTLYAHNSRLLVRSGDWVQRGDIIAKSGNTGNSTGPHLHFEVQVNSRPVNPLDYIN